MKGFIKKIIWSLYFKLVQWYGRSILKYRTKQYQALLSKAYIYTFEIFPDELLSSNSKIVEHVVNEYIGAHEQVNDIEFEENGESCICLREKLEADNEFVKMAANYHLLTEYYYSIGYESFENERKSAKHNAEKYTPNISSITNKSFVDIRKSISADLKKMRKQIKKLTSERMHAERLQRINKYKIKSSDAIFLSSVFSVLFLVSGFVYSKAFFGMLGVSISDFFSVSDYVSSSVDVIVSSVIATGVGLVYFVWGLSDSVNNRIHSDIFEVERKESDVPLFLSVTALSVIAVTQAYFNGKTDYTTIAILAFFVIMYFFFRWSLLDYIENRTIFGVIVFSLSMFIYHLGSSVVRNIDDLRNGNYTSTYNIKYAEGYGIYAENVFISSNSNYVFLWDQGEKVVNVIPRSAVISYQSKRD